MGRHAVVGSDTAEYLALSITSSAERAAFRDLEKDAKRHIAEANRENHARTLRSLADFISAGGSLYMAMKAMGITSFYTAKDLIAEAQIANLRTAENASSYEISDVDDEFDRTYLVSFLDGTVWPVSSASGRQSLLNGETSDGEYVDSLAEFEARGVLQEISDTILE